MDAAAIFLDNLLQSPSAHTLRCIPNRGRAMLLLPDKCRMLPVEFQCLIKSCAGERWNGALGIYYHHLAKRANASRHANEVIFIFICAN